MNHSRNTLRRAIMGLGLGLTVTATQAGGFVDRAKVTHVEPIVKRIEVVEPHTECWQEKVSRPHRHHGHRSHTPEIIGAIVGSAIGHQFGSGRGKHVATAAGAILGGSIAHDLKKRHHYNHGQHGYHVVTEKRCKTVNHVSYERRVVGYRVEYRYRGHGYTTRTDYHPGNTIKVRVSVAPIS